MHFFKNNGLVKFLIFCLNRDVYVYVCAAAYGVGLLVTFLALAVMGSGQPALLYIVPLTLGTTVVIGWSRKELRQLWIGEPVSAYSHTFLFFVFFSGLLMLPVL